MKPSSVFSVQSAACSHLLRFFFVLVRCCDVKLHFCSFSNLDQKLIVRCKVGVVKSCALNASAAADCSDILSHHFCCFYVVNIRGFFFLFLPADILLINNKAIRQQTDVQIQLSRDIVQFNQIKLQLRQI